MVKKTPKYRITPSLLNSYQTMIDSDLLWEQFYGGQEDPSITAEEYFAKCEQELIDACNRVPFTSEAASRGTALNEIVDCILDRRKQREDMKVERVYEADECASGVVALRAELDGFSFIFDIGLVRKLTDYFFGAICQHRCEATIDTAFGPVILYGDADYIIRDVVYDLKTTGNYSFGKYIDKGWQCHLYPYALIESGEVQYISGFEYTVAQLKGGTNKSPLITGDIYREWHDFSFEDSKLRLREITESFVQWIEAHKDRITHKRIFNEI